MTAPGFTLMVCGGRAFSDRPAVTRALDAIHALRPIWLLVHGGAPGADTLAHDWAIAAEVAVTATRADWATHGRAAGPIRNRAILDTFRPHLLLAFQGGPGTADACKAAAERGVPVARQGSGVSLRALVMGLAVTPAA